MLKVKKESKEEPNIGFRRHRRSRILGFPKPWTSPEKKKAINVDYYYTEMEKKNIKLFLLMELKNPLTQKERKYVADFMSSRYGNCGKECRF